MSAPVLRDGHQLQLLQGGAEFFPALIQAIDASHTEVRLETDIFHFDVSGERVAQALVQAAARGVAVYLLMDGAGTPQVPLAWQQRLTQGGVHWRLYSPLGPLGLLIPGRWRRLHRKLCVVDAHTVFCGGINIVDDWLDPVWGTLDAARQDFSVQAQGPLVADVQRTMVQLWERLEAGQQLQNFRLKEATQRWRASVRPQAAALSRSGPPGGRRDSAQAALVLRDNLRNRTQIERSYRRALADARHEVWIANAYFLPGGKLRRALVHAARRGVRVRLIVQGRYENFMQFHASRPVLARLLAAGIEVHEYMAGFLHAKVAVVDGRWATVGSSNLDPLSLLLAREANLVVLDAPFAQDLRTRLDHIWQTQCHALDAEQLARRSLRMRALDWLAFAAMRASLFLMAKRY